jgi:hypothetical protein
MGEKAAPAVPALMDALFDKDVTVRKLAIEALGEIGAPSAPAVPALAKILAERYLYLNIRVIWTLGKIGEKSAPALPALWNFIEQNSGEKFLPEHRIIDDSAETIEKIGASAIPSIIQMLDSKSIRVAVTALTALERQAKNRKLLERIEPAIPVLARILMERKRYISRTSGSYHDTFYYLDYCAASILERMRDKSVPALLDIMMLEGYQRSNAYFVREEREEDPEEPHLLIPKDRPIYAADVLIQIGRVIMTELEQALQEEKYAKIHADIKDILYAIKWLPNMPLEQEPKKKYAYVCEHQTYVSGLVYVFDSTRMPYLVETLLKGEEAQKKLAIAAFKEFGPDALPDLEKALAEERFSSIHAEIKKLIEDIKSKEKRQKRQKD